MNKTKDVACYFVYDKFDNVTQYLRCQRDKMCKDLGISFKRLSEYMARGIQLEKHSVYKLTKDEEMERLI